MKGALVETSSMEGELSSLLCQMQDSQRQLAKLRKEIRQAVTVFGNNSKQVLALSATRRRLAAEYRAIHLAYESVDGPVWNQTRLGKAYRGYLESVRETRLVTFVQVSTEGQPSLLSADLVQAMAQ